MFSDFAIYLKFILFVIEDNAYVISPIEVFAKIGNLPML